MAEFITLIKYTQKGIENIRESPRRLDMAKEAFKAYGAELKAFFLVMGRYDMVIVSEAPDEATVAKVSLSIGSRGSVTTETFRAFNEDEYREIIGAMP